MYKTKSVGYKIAQKKHTANSLSTASLKATSWIAAALEAASASIRTFRKGLFPLLKFSGLKTRLRKRKPSGILEHTAYFAQLMVRFTNKYVFHILTQTQLLPGH